MEIRYLLRKFDVACLAHQRQSSLLPRTHTVARPSLLSSLLSSAWPAWLAEPPILAPASADK
jgi:hypothetical protein